MAEHSQANRWLRKLFQYFFQGIVVLAPICITLYAVIWLFSTMDNILPDLLYNFFPNNLSKANGLLRTIPGLGFVAVVIIVIFFGRISSGFFASRIFDALDHVLQRTPGLKFIYTSVKDILQAFTGNKKKFNRPVLVNIGEEDVWRVGFITQESAGHFDLPQHDVVYIPLAYSITGVTYIVPRKKIKLLINISPAEAMKFAVSGGVAEVD